MVPPLTISSALLAAIVRHAEAAPDREGCGLLFGTDHLIAAHEPTANVAANPARQFEVDPARLIAAHRAMRHGGPRLIGHYHSHPQGRATPSPRDAAQSIGDGAAWLIVAGGAAALWRSHRPGAFLPWALRVVAA